MSQKRTGACASSTKSCEKRPRTANTGQGSTALSHAGNECGSRNGNERTPRQTHRNALHQPHIEANLVPLNDRPLNLAERQTDGSMPRLGRFLDEVVDGIAKGDVRASVRVRKMVCARGAVERQTLASRQRTNW